MDHIASAGARLLGEVAERVGGWRELGRRLKVSDAYLRAVAAGRKPPSAKLVCSLEPFDILAGDWRPPPPPGPLATTLTPEIDRLAERVSGAAAASARRLLETDVQWSPWLDPSTELPERLEGLQASVRALRAEVIALDRLIEEDERALADQLASEASHKATGLQDCAGTEIP
jgi:hypothetical protein